MKTVHCKICGYPVKGTTFQARMAKLRRHRKTEHPKAHSESLRKALRTKAKLDPLKARKKLVATPRVLNLKDYKGQGFIRVLWRANETTFPEFALYVKFRGMAHQMQDDMLKDAGLTEESKGKWVLRTNKFSIFVFV